jgi:hypothetical protein
MPKKLLLILILGMILGGPATHLFGIGSTAAYAAEDDDSQGESDAQGEVDDGQ